MINIPPVSPVARQHAKTHPLTFLVWHDIVRQDKLVWFDTTIAEFTAQLEKLARAGAQPITLEHAFRYLQSGTPSVPPGSCVLCFDDNTGGIHDFATPLLIRRGWPYAVSAHTAYIGRKTSKTHSSFAMLKEMEKKGGTIVSQTHTHPPDLRSLSDAALVDEFTRSKSILEQALGHPVSFVTYPSGKWDARVAETAQEAGYSLGLTEDFGPAETSPHLLGIHRYSSHRRFAEAVNAIARSASR